MRCALFFFGAFAVLSAAQASPAARGDLAERPDFELSDGRQFVRLSEWPARPTVVNFWRADCPPCLKEIPELARLAREGRVRVVAVALQRPAETLAAPVTILDELKAPMILLHGPSEPRGLLSRFGNPQGALPHTVWLDAAGRVCAKKTGRVDTAWLNAQGARCGN